jgi:Zn finger protein HypA/HybF involved in hydrogenase expression
MGRIPAVYRYANSGMEGSMRVIVKSRDGFHECQQKSNLWFKCGRCGRGNVLASKGYKCLVCKAKVAQVIKDNEFVLQEHYVSPPAGKENING